MRGEGYPKWTQMLNIHQKTNSTRKYLFDKPKDKKNLDIVQLTEALSQV